MEMKTFRDYCDSLGVNPIIPPDYPDYLKEYEENQTAMDIDTKVKFGSLYLVTEDKETLDKLIIACKVRNAYKWRTLWETMNYEYDPVYNVEEHTTTTTEYGEHKTETDMGEKVKSTEYGQHETSVNLGKRTDRTSEDGYNYPYDNPDKQAHTAHNQIENGSDAVTDTTTSNSHTDTTTDNAAKDTVTSGAHKDVVTVDRAGNIGVKSAQALILEQRDVAVFDFLSMVMNDVVDAVTIPYYENDCYKGVLYS